MVENSLHDEYPTIHEFLKVSLIVKAPNVFTVRILNLRDSFEGHHEPVMLDIEKVARALIFGPSPTKIAEVSLS